MGRRVYDWVDRKRIDPYAHGRETAREIAAIVWYPADASPSNHPAAYLPRGWGLHKLLWGVDADRVVTHSVDRAPVVSGDSRFPALIFSPAAWPPFFYAAMLEELASHGYIVVGLAHTHEMIPMTVFADGRRRWFRKRAVAGALTVSKRPHAEDVRDRGAVTDYKAEDVRFALDQLTAIDTGSDALAGRIDVHRVGAFGHSFGGGASVVACQADPRITACANLDGGLWREPQQIVVDHPSLLVFADHPEMTQPCAESVRQKMFSSVDWCEQDRALHMACWERQVSSSRPGYCVQIRGSEHRTFMDWRLLPLRRWSIGRMGHATIDGRSMWESTTQCLLMLFEKHVRGANAPTIEQLVARFDELTMGSPQALFDQAERSRRSDSE